MSDRFSSTRRGRGSFRAESRRRWHSLERLEPRTLCAAQSVDSVFWAPVTLGFSPSNWQSITTPQVAGARATSLSDDRFEENDSISSAADLGTITAPQTISQLVMADRADWFQFTLGATGSAGNNAAIDFRHAQGDLDMALYDAQGKRVALSNGVRNHEQVSLAGRAAGTYYLIVYGYRGIKNPSYSLTLTVDAGSTSSGGSTSGGGASTGGFSIDFSFSGLTTSQQAIFQQAAAKWEAIIVGDLPNATYGGRVVDDLLIDASAVRIDGVGNVLGQAGPDRFRSGSSLPYHGTMQFDKADLASMEADGTLAGVVAHEIGHVLGIGTLWDSKGLIVGARTANPRYVGANAVAQYAAIFGTNDSSVPLETKGGAGTRDSHWRESLFGNELMTGYVGPGTMLPLSRITVGALADLGYSVNYAAADPYTPPQSLLSGTSSGSGVTGTTSSIVQASLPPASQNWRLAAPVVTRAVDWLFGRRWNNWLA